MTKCDEKVIDFVFVLCFSYQDNVSAECFSFVFHLMLFFLHVNKLISAATHFYHFSHLYKCETDDSWVFFFLFFTLSNNV